MRGLSRPLTRLLQNRIQENDLWFLGCRTVSVVSVVESMYKRSLSLTVYVFDVTGIHVPGLV